MQKRAAYHYLNFTRKERNGTVFLLLTILICLSLPFIYPIIFKEQKITKTDFQKELASLKTEQKDSTRKYFLKGKEGFDDRNYYNTEKRNEYADHGAVFNFDPNTISDDGWKKLGLREKTIATIRNYLAKGGKFRKPEDIKKIWGMHEELVNRLLPFVDIKEKDPGFPILQQDHAPKIFERKKVLPIVDINESDTLRWAALPGIGPKLSNRIINFREKLGGFYSIDQVAETFGLADSVFQKIKPGLLLSNKKLRQLNINTATLDEMKQHPYIRYNLANLIVQYRGQHGNFGKVDDIKKIMTVTEDQYQKLLPYLTVQ